MVGAPSASASHDAGKHHYARYHLYRVDLSGSAPRTTVEVRGLAPDRMQFVTEQTFELKPPTVGAADGAAP